MPNDPPRSDASRTAHALRRAYTGPVWHGPSIGELLAGTSATHAVQKPVDGGHSIWELVSHLTLWTDEARARLAGGTLSPTAEQNFPTPDDTSTAAWLEAVAGLERAHEALAAAIETMGDDALDAKVADRPHTNRTMLHGVVSHTAYHAGQISLLRRALGLPGVEP
jgi:uncharacterized damage-inducible protein DinB